MSHYLEISELSKAYDTPKGRLVTVKNSWHVGETPNPEPWRKDFAIGYGPPGHLDKELRVILKSVEGHWLIDAIRSPKVPARAVP